MVAFADISCKAFNQRLRMFLDLAQEPAVQEAYDAVEFCPELYGQVTRLLVRYLQVFGNPLRNEQKSLDGLFLFTAGHLLQRSTYAVEEFRNAAADEHNLIIIGV